jgi:hypothetical protein
MDDYIATVGTNSNNTSSSGSLPLNSSGNTVFLALVVPVIFFALNKGWEFVQWRVQQANKKEDSEIKQDELTFQSVIAEKERLLENAVQQQQTVFNELVVRNHAQIEKLFELQGDIQQTQITIAEAVKFNSQNILANTIEIATSIKSNNETTTSYLVSALNTQSALYADTNRQMQKVLDSVDALHRRFDQQYGASNARCDI